MNLHSKMPHPSGYVSAGNALSFVLPLVVNFEDICLWLGSDRTNLQLASWMRSETMRRTPARYWNGEVHLLQFNGKARGFEEVMFL